MSVCELEIPDKVEAPFRDMQGVAIEAPPAVRPPRRRGWVVALLIAALAAAIFLILFRPIPMSTAKSINSDSFDFSVKQVQDHLLLTWNPSAPAVRDATRATLVIHDGPETEDVGLNLAVLPRGGLRYAPVFRNIGFRLILENGSRAHSSEQFNVILHP